MIAPPPIGPASALARLTHNRWALPVLAEVARTGGCKLVTLSRRLGASPGGLKRALETLAELDLVVRNPGYGHPLRPEYILGPRGVDAGDPARSLLAWSRDLESPEEVFKKWQLPVLVALRADASRFSDVRRRLPGSTPRAVTLALKSHAALGLVAREVEPGYPPSPLYTATPRALPGRAPAVDLGGILAGA